MFFNILLILQRFIIYNLELNQKCAEFKKTVHFVNGTKEIEVRFLSINTYNNNL